jgi:phage shock protein E
VKRNKSIPLAGLALLCIITFAASACGSDVPNLKAEELKELLASDKRVLVVDTRSEAEYVRGHIPGAILVSEEKVQVVDRFFPAGTEKETTIVFYCRGGG